MEEILENKPGKKVILLGNEAIVRGALESGVQYVSTYPGTPASEIGNVFSQIAKTVGVYFEFSTNEKVALESAIGANFSGLKTLVAMKNFGLNVALESLFPLCYTGTKAGMVIIVADDPNCWSSAQSEENSRGFAKVLHIPILEPSDPQECKDFVKLGFEISEKFKIPVIVRTTTRVAHQSAIVKMSEVNIPLFQFQGKFVKDVKRFVTMPPRVLEMKKELLEKIEKIKKYSEKSKINQLLSFPEAEQARYQAGKPQVLKTGIITSGISYLHTIEGLKELNIRVPVLKLGFFYPLPEEKIKKFIKGLKKILIIEELEPYLEEEINRLAKDTNPKLQVFGKDLLSEIGELRPEFVTAAIAKIIGQSYKLSSARYSLQTKHLPRFCPGCPYWSVFATIKKVAPEGTIFGGDIGCYMLAGQPPHLMQDYLSCMGSSIGIAHGISKALRYNSGQVTEQKVITFIGDSTFFHAGIPALINTIFNKSNPLIIILDNQTTAMTGHQPHPGVGKTGMGEETTSVKIEDIVQACGVKNLKVVDPINVQEFEKAVKEFLEKEEASVIIARHMCALLAKKKET